jgi:hypothetical protein
MRDLHRFTAGSAPLHCGIRTASLRDLHRFTAGSRIHTSSDRALFRDRDQFAYKNKSNKDVTKVFPEGMQRLDWKFKNKRTDIARIDSDLALQRSSRFVRVILGKLLDYHREGDGAMHNHSTLDQALTVSLRTVLGMIGAMTNRSGASRTKFEEFRQQVFIDMTALLKDSLRLDVFVAFLDDFHARMTSDSEMHASISSDTETNADGPTRLLQPNDLYLFYMHVPYSLS